MKRLYLLLVCTCILFSACGGQQDNGIAELNAEKQEQVSEVNEKKTEEAYEKEEAEEIVSDETVMEPVGEEKKIGGTLINDIEEIRACKYTKDHTSTNIFGLSYERQQIGSITFLSSMPDKTEAGFDVSESKDGTVLAWFEKDNEGYYDVTIASDGLIQFPEDCIRMFAYCENLKSIDFAHNVDTRNVARMTWMFEDDCTLTQLDLTGFNTVNVTNMFGTFMDCRSLTKLDSFNTMNVNSMREMFWHCEALKTLDLSGFDFSSVEFAQYMYSDTFNLSVTVDKSKQGYTEYLSLEAVLNGAEDLKLVDIQ